MKKKLTFLIALVVVIAFLFAPRVERHLEWESAAEAVSSFPYVLGLTNVIMIPCTTTGTPPICTGGTYCNIKDAATCTTYEDVSGTQSGGMGNEALFSIMQISQAGLTSGGSLIAGGMGPTLMDSGVLASSGGCSGCTARASRFDRIKTWFNDFIIAGIRRDF